MRTHTKEAHLAPVAADETVYRKSNYPFVLTQRNAAIARIGLSDNEELKAEVLSKLCTSAGYATVGISHLTTSRQHLAPAVSVVAAGR